MTTRNRSSVFPLLVCGLLLLPCASFGNEAEEKFRAMDSDGDGRLTRTEHAAGAEKIFAQLDTNSDGVITSVEMEAKPGNKMGAWDKDEGMAAAEKIALVDANLDGQASWSEHESAAALMFGRMDTDNDGYLSKEECAAGHRPINKGRK